MATPTLSEQLQPHFKIAIPPTSSSRHTSTKSGLTSLSEDTTKPAAEQMQCLASRRGVSMISIDTSFDVMNDEDRTEENMTVDLLNELFGAHTPDLDMTKDN